MQHIYSIRTIFFGFLSMILLNSCSKSDLLPNEQAVSTQETVITNAVAVGENKVAVGAITLTAPMNVKVNESFDIAADFACGRVSLERGYIIGPDNIKVYKNIEPGMPGIQWEPVIRFHDPSTRLNWKSSITEKGVYLFRTKHTAGISQNNGSNAVNMRGTCSFSGNQVYYFMIEAMDPCATSFTGNISICGANNTVVYRFITANDENDLVIQGELANFIGPDATVTVSGAPMKVTQLNAATNSNRVIKIEGDVSACSEVVITVNWSSTNYDNIITSDWTVKNAEESDLAPAVPALECDSRKAGRK
jgi:hypothetical protein